jgi:signal peptidase I
MSTTFSDDPVALELRRLADDVPALVPSPALAADVLRLARRPRPPTRRRLLIACAVLLVGGGLLATTVPGRNPRFAVTEPSASMTPVIRTGERVVFDRSLEAQRGDVVVAEVANGGEAFETIRRVVGVAGDVVTCPPTGSGGPCAAVEVNGRVVDEPYLDGVRMEPFDAVTVPAARVFLLGDNRGNSIDSRHYGPVSLSALDGVAVSILDHDGVARPVPGAPPRDDEGGLVDPAGPVPPARAATPGS